jgi:hypothetical protein
MFLLKRRSDGKFFRNKGYHQDSHWRYTNRDEDDPRWVSDPNKCVPFATVVGLKRSRGAGLGEAPLGIPYPQQREDWRPYWNARGEWYSKKNRKARMKWEQEKFDELYEIVEVKFKVGK